MNGEEASTSVNWEIEGGTCWHWVSVRDWFFSTHCRHKRRITSATII